MEQLLYTESQISQILKEFNRRFKGKLFYRDIINSTWESIDSFKRDRYYRAQSIFLNNRIVIPLSHGYQHLYIQDYTGEFYPILKAEGLSNIGDILKYRLAINLPKVSWGKASIFALDIDPVLSKPWHVILEDEALEKAMISDTDNCAIYFFQGIHHMTGYWVWVDGTRMNDQTPIYGTVTTLFIP